MLISVMLAQELDNFVVGLIGRTGSELQDGYLLARNHVIDKALQLPEDQQEKYLQESCAGPIVSWAVNFKPGQSLVVTIGDMIGIEVIGMNQVGQAAVLHCEVCCELILIQYSAEGESRLKVSDIYLKDVNQSVHHIEELLLPESTSCEYQLCFKQVLVLLPLHPASPSLPPS